MFNLAGALHDSLAVKLDSFWIGVCCFQGGALERTAPCHDPRRYVVNLDTRHPMHTCQHIRTGANHG